MKRRESHRDFALNGSQPGKPSRANRPASLRSLTGLHTELSEEGKGPWRAREAPARGPAAAARRASQGGCWRGSGPRVAFQARARGGAAACRRRSRGAARCIGLRRGASAGAARPARITSRCNTTCTVLQPNEANIALQYGIQACHETPLVHIVPRCKRVPAALYHRLCHLPIIAFVAGRRLPRTWSSGCGRARRPRCCYPMLDTHTYT